MTEAEEGDTGMFACISGVPDSASVCYDPGEPALQPPVPGARAIMDRSRYETYDEQGRSRPVVGFVP